jgi:hypothetical protein
MFIVNQEDTARSVEWLYRLYEACRDFPGLRQRGVRWSRLIHEDVLHWILDNHVCSDMICSCRAPSFVLSGNPRARDVNELIVWDGKLVSRVCEKEHRLLPHPGSFSM